MSGRSVDPLWTVQRADDVLAAASADRDRIAAALADLDGSFTRRILQTAALAGGTAAAWAQVRDAIADLWADFQAYTAVVDQARALRGRRGRADSQRLAQLRELLVTVTAEEVAGRVRPAEPVARMDARYARITGLLQAVDAVWTDVLPRLEKAEQRRRSAEAAAQEIEPSLADRLAPLASSLAFVRETVTTDPLSLAAGAPALDAAEAVLDGVLAEVERITALRDGLAERLAAIEAIVERVEQTEEQSAREHTRAVARISGLDFPAAPRTAEGLRRRLTAVAAVPVSRASSQLADEVDAVQQAARAALDAAEAALARFRAPLRLRDELRGRLEAYRGKTLALGLAEDAALATLYSSARDLLWTAPCDIGAAASLVNRYQHEITGRRR